MESLEEFKKKVQRVRDSKHFKITNSWGVYDAYKAYRKDKPEGKEYKINDCYYYKIVRMMNNLMAEALLQGESFKFPKGMGQLEIRKVERKVTIDENGKVKCNMPIDWGETMKLWYEDPVAMKQKKLIRNEDKALFKLYYSKETATYQNQSFYEFYPNVDLKRSIRRQALRGKLTEAPLLYKPKEMKYGKSI